MKKLTNYLLLSFAFMLSAFVLNAQDDPNTPLFEIKNDAGQTVFAVYPGGVRIFVDDDTQKATGGGFRVGRIGTEKAGGNDIFTVIPGEVNVFIDNKKATGGGFRVGRVGTEKATGAGDIFTVNPGEINVFIDEALKATGGGFRVGRVGTEKATGAETDYFRVTPDSTRVNISPNSVDGFAVGRIGELEPEKFLNVTPENTFIGYNAGKNIGRGKGNVFLGYMAGSNAKEGSSNLLYIANSDTETPLIFGNFEEQSINITGSLLVNGEIISPSDQRLKTNILKFTKGLEVILALNSYYFDWNEIAINELGLADKRQVGVLAQELEKLMPELVVENSKNGYKSVDYIKLTPVIIQAIKEQNTQITELEKRIENLEKLNQTLMKDMEEVEDLKSDIENLKKMVIELNKK